MRGRRREGSVVRRRGSFRPKRKRKRSEESQSPEAQPKSDPLSLSLSLSLSYSPILPDLNPLVPTLFPSSRRRSSSSSSVDRRVTPPSSRLKFPLLLVRQRVDVVGPVCTNRRRSTNKEKRIRIETQPPTRPVCFFRPLPPPDQNEKKRRQNVRAKQLFLNTRITLPQS